ncbi:MAG: DUF1574 domain-containing protein [Candidatus Obscuribacterales bacterium]|nr:DUF1574 domain-containing protein [Candidatus Obscuribacterales bacterium]
MDNKSYLKYFAVLIGVVLFIAANLAFFAWQPLAKVDPECLPSAHTWTWWAGREYFGQTRTPELVILGSSLLMKPLAQVDAVYLNKDFDYVKHHQSQYLSHLLSDKAKIAGLQCFNFALPGAMVSDDFMVLRTLITQKRKPAVVVLGLGARDFIDSGVSCPAATPPFRYLRRFCNIDDLVELSMPQIWQKLEYWIGQSIYLWGKKLDLQVMLTEATKANLGPYYAANFQPCKLVEANPEKNVPGNLRSEIEAGVYMINAHETESFADNTDEYKKRFRNKNEKMFAIQSEFLDKFLYEAMANNVRVLLVNVPVTAANRALMPEGAYHRYLALMHKMAKKWDVPLLQPNQSVTFKHSDYSDTAHMNSVGGRKLLESVASYIAADRYLPLALNRPDRTERGVAGRNQLY